MEAKGRKIRGQVVSKGVVYILGRASGQGREPDSEFGLYEGEIT